MNFGVVSTFLRFRLQLHLDLGLDLELEIVMVLPMAVMRITFETIVMVWTAMKMTKKMELEWIKSEMELVKISKG